MAYSIRKMAEALGVSKSQVARDAQAGMPMQDVAGARAWRLANQDMARTAEGRIDRPAAGAAGPVSMPGDTDREDGPEVDDEPLPAGASDRDTQAYRAERAKREGIRREREQLQLEQERGRLVDVNEVARLQFTAQRLTRDRVEMVAARVAPEAVALVQSGGDGFGVERLVSQHLRQALEDAAKAIEEIDTDDEATD